MTANSTVQAVSRKTHYIIKFHPNWFEKLKRGNRGTKWFNRSKCSHPPPRRPCTLSLKNLFSLSLKIFFFMFPVHPSNLCMYAPGIDTGGMNITDKLGTQQCWYISQECKSPDFFWLLLNQIYHFWFCITDFSLQFAKD